MGSDARRRRAERVRRRRLKTALPKYGKYVLILVVLVATIAAAATFVKLPPGKRFIHDHASFALFIGGEKVSFVHPDYDAGQRGMGPPHMHIGDGREIWHIEGSFVGGRSDLTLADSSLYNGVTFRQGSMKLDTLGGHNGTEWRDQGNATWEVYVSRMVGDQRAPFERIEGDYSQYAPQNLDMILVTYGDLTPEELARQQAAVPQPPG